MSNDKSNANSARMWALTAPFIVVFSVSLLLPCSPVHGQVAGSGNVNTSQLANYQNECAITKNPTNKLQLFAACNNAGAGLFAARSNDLGVSWTAVDAVDGTIADGDVGQGPAACCDPTVAWDSFGNLYLGYLGAVSGVEVLISTDNGATFNNLATFAGSVDQPTLVAADTTAPGAPVAVWVVWNQSGQMRARGAAVTGLGLVGAFNPLQTIPGTLGCSFGDIAIAPSGAVVQACQNPTGGQGPATIFVNTDADGLGPGNFGAAVAATTTNVGGFDFIPAQNTRSIDAEAGLAYDSFDGTGALPGFPGPSPHLGRLYLVYTEEAVPENSDTNILVRFSDNDGANWSGPIQVNDDGTTRSQFLPKIASNTLSGNIAVCWHDARDDPANTTMREYCSIATPTGAVPIFLANAQIGAVSSTGAGSSPPVIGEADIQYGDYSGLTYFQGRAHPIWADNSNSTGDNPDLTNRYDAYTDRVDGGVAANEGDPHLTTVDGVHYDFQTAGEFVSLRGDGIEIQTRQTAVGTSFFPGPNAHTGLATCASLNTAVAGWVGNHRVTYQPNLSGVPDPSGLQLRIDGVLTSLGSAGIDLGSGGRITKTSAAGGIRIEFANGTVLVVTPGWWASQSKWYLNVNVFRTTANEGILGVIRPGDWLPALPDGTSLGPRPSAVADRYVPLNETFADAWRVTDASSLFDYAPGTSTATFTIASWPKDSPPCVVPREPVAKPLSLEAAADFCSVIADDNRKANCIFDVRVTGEVGFAETYRLTQRLEAIENGEDPPPDNGPISVIPTHKRWAKSFHVGGAHPLGDFNKPTDSNVHFRLDASYPLTDNIRLLAMAGYSQFTAETATGANHPRWINFSVNAQGFFPTTATGLRWFVQGGPGAYWPESGSSDTGFNLGFGTQIPLASGPFAIELGADYHNVQADETQEFVTVQLGVIFR